MGERAAGGNVCSALGDGGVILVGPGLIVFSRVGEGLKQRVVALGFDQAQRGRDLSLGQFVDQAMQLLPVRHASMVPLPASEVASGDRVPNRVPKSANLTRSNLT